MFSGTLVQDAGQEVCDRVESQPACKEFDDGEEAWNSRLVEEKEQSLKAGLNDKKGAESQEQRGQRQRDWQA